MHIVHGRLSDVALLAQFVQGGRMTIPFTAAFTGQLSSLHGVTFQGAPLRIQQGQEYVMTIEPDGKTSLALAPSDPAPSESSPTEVELAV